MAYAERMIEHSKSTIHPLHIGDKIPPITVYRRCDGSAFDLNEAIANTPTILIYYRGSWCPYCNVHLAKIRDIEDKLARLGYQILAISADKPSLAAETQDTHKMKFEILSDATMQGADTLGISFDVTPETIEEFHIYELDLEDISGNKHHKLPVPAVFLLDREGIIKFEYVNPNFMRRISTDALLEQARKYKV